MDFIAQALSWIGDFIATCLLAVATPFINLLPTPDVSFIDDMVLYQANTFHPAILFNWDMLVMGATILFDTFVVCLFVSIVKFVLDTVHNVADSIPVIG